MNHFSQNRRVHVPDPVFSTRPRVITSGEDLELAMSGGLDFNDLSPDQAEVFEQVMDWFIKARKEHMALLSMGGYAGTGKSTLVSVLAKELEVSSTEQFKIAFCAYTGKAANVLQQKLRQANVKASRDGMHHHYCGTIHSLIYKPDIDGRGEVVDWHLKPEEEIAGEYSLIVVDEASMVEEKMLQDLQSYGVPILAVGDHGQLPPINGAFSLMEEPDLRLEKIHRQAEGNPIIHLSKIIRETGKLPEVEEWENTPAVRFCTFNELFGLLEPLYETTDVRDIAILTYKNKTRCQMNYQARCMRNRKHMSPEPIEGDQMICLRNVKGTLFNGMRGILESRPVDFENHWYSGKLYFPDDELDVKGVFLRHQLNRDKTFQNFDEVNNLTGQFSNSWGKMGLLLDYGYALTVHKSQGSQFKHVFLMYERGRQTPDEFRRWLYTAATRAQETLTIVVG